MASEMDEDRLFAEIEQHLAREDPDLAARISALDGQFPDTTTPPASDENERQWTMPISLILAAIAVIGLLLTAILNAPPAAEEQQRPPTGQAVAQLLYPYGGSD
ncbi:DUF3040 domain-containing protein [Streptomyces lavendulocolor]|uniref:DUF3040 domain-containing protein n=1 Tax=Streptomyces lavendulocolor TaxID=67316 RepID=UPI003C2CFF30